MTITRLIPANAYAFVDRLAELPAAEWVAIGRAVASDHGLLPVRQRAWTAIDDAITDQGLGVIAWYLREAVDTAAFLASRGVSRWPRDGRRMFAAAHSVAETAALALLACADLDPEALHVVCAPLSSLFGDLFPGEQRAFSGSTVPRPPASADRAVPHTPTSAGSGDLPHAARGRARSSRSPG